MLAQAQEWNRRTCADIDGRIAQQAACGTSRGRLDRTGEAGQCRCRGDWQRADGLGRRDGQCGGIAGGLNEDVVGRRQAGTSDGIAPDRA